MHNVLIAIWYPILYLHPVQVYMLAVTWPLERNDAGLMLLVMTEIKMLFICKSNLLRAEKPNLCLRSNERRH